MMFWLFIVVRYSFSIIRVVTCNDTYKAVQETAFFLKETKFSRHFSTSHDETKFEICPSSIAASREMPAEFGLI